MCIVLYLIIFFFFKQKTAYERRISDWSSDVCSSDLPRTEDPGTTRGPWSPPQAPSRPRRLPPPAGRRTVDQQAGRDHQARVGIEVRRREQPDDRYRQSGV